ncbi:MAG: septum formation protein Maf [Parcubacteria group bacterium CG1_02_39_15]|uniref:Nucleoside triphosphate pyrophosphatase n=3 Tax=Candidatus Nealsoniibacteriota TaxID=1817911 RepID=A0A2G9YTE4_9BACT|nr:MAG: septum formation protein Maf [Parcubacteria group bacterium CG1_02_39_15]PIP22525.1 MAG: septum formation protein Maf [Candidatus Nealsonbacteria bacterium CG23_combo_of_CG06-09_8_20_14_all_39_25]PIQ98521.1 MAG: septum formation protein Maf [Candidatus Nealsonbacteria bacterium CG11_big_fil_rev_8_21_14_0_20_39_9]PIW90553.1 MAG: septum formation protein Maf [Candidatus Nealsonbacteria bacterium CG_4_8_14_3_um_filter_40_11]
MPKIILATTSPYRKEVFGYLGIPFEAEGSNLDESQAERNNPEELVKTLSKLKTDSVAKNHLDAIVIGLDSVGFFEGKILEKPKSKEEAFQRLRSLSGKKYDFYTGVYMVNTSTQKSITRVVKTEVFMRKLSDSEINRYLDQDPNYNKYAHGYDIKNYASSTFPAKLVGSYTNALMGIPVEVIIEMLPEIGYKL